MRNKEEIRLQRVVVALSATLFAVFSFLFVAKFQTSLLELLYERVATGKLEYNAYVVGASISIFLTLFALWINRYTGFKREWTALSYLPSSILLAFITDIDRSLYIGGYNYLKWIIVALIGVFAYASFSYVLRRVLFAKIKNVAMSANRIVWRNLEIFVVLFCLVGFLSNGEENFKREALVESYYRKGNVKKALEVGCLSNTVSQTLATQRAYILAKEGLLGEKLFEYPQPYSSDVLFPEDVQISPLVPDSVFSLIGVNPIPGEKMLETLKRAVESDSSTSAARDYYLSAMLLDRRLVEFAGTVASLYPDVKISDMPKHYQEALVLYSNIDGSVVDSDNNGMQKHFDAFKDLEKQYDDPFVRANYMRRNFGRTYWWYYLYGNI